MCVMPIYFAIENTIQQFEDPQDETEQMILELLKRSLEMWRTLQIHGLEMYEMTYEEFCKQCEEKHNIVFLSDEEIKEINTIRKVMHAIKQSGVMI